MCDALKLGIHSRDKCMMALHLGRNAHMTCIYLWVHDGGAGLADDNAKVQAAAANMLNLALTLPDAPADLGSVLVRSKEHTLIAFLCEASCMKLLCGVPCNTLF